MQKAKGGYLWDVDGNRYIDYRLAFGPIILGHAYPEVDARVCEEIDKGVLFAMTSELEVAVVEKIVAMCPAVEMVRLACSGTEATMHALRVARAYTGRESGDQVRGHVPRLPGLHCSSPPTLRSKRTAAVAARSPSRPAPAFRRP